MIGGMFTDTGMPSWRAAWTVMGKSWVQRPSLSVIARAAAWSFGWCFRRISATKAATWSTRLRGDIREHEHLVADLRRLLQRDDFQDRGRRQTADLGVDGPEDCVRVHHDLVRRERDQRPA